MADSVLAHLEKLHRRLFRQLAPIHKTTKEDERVFFRVFSVLRLSSRSYFPLAVTIFLYPTSPKRLDKQNAR